VANITDRELAAAIRTAKKTGADVWVRNIEKSRGVGRLEFRAKAAGDCSAYFRYTDSTGKRDRVPSFAVYDPRGESGLTLKEIFAKSSEYSRLYQSDTATCGRTWNNRKPRKSRARLPT
jgi:hypothetical protein